MVLINKFIDDSTILFIGLDKFLKEFVPVSEHGKRQATRLAAYLPEDFEELQNHHDRIKYVLQMIKQTPEIIDRIKNQLRKLPDLGDVWDVQFTQSEFALLARFRACHHHIYKTLSKKGELSSWLELLDDDELGKDIFNEPISAEFYLEDNASDELFDARQKLQNLQNKLDENQQSRIDAVSQKYQLSNNINSWVIDRLKQELTAKMLADPELLLLEDNITSTVFTLKNDEQVLEQKTKLRSLLELEGKAEQQIYLGLEKVLRKRKQLYIAEQEKLAQLDLLITFAELAKKQNTVCPEIFQEKKCGLKLDKGRHVILKAKVEQSSGKYQALDIELKNKGAMLSGSNMGGKTVVLQTVGLLQAIMQLGFFVPAASAYTKLYNQICSLSKTSEELGGLSGFGREINRLKQILPLRNLCVLFLLDEPASSTCISEGKALVLSIIEHITKSPSLLLIASHLDNLKNGKLEVLKMAGLKKKLHEENHELSLNELMDYRVLKKTDKTSTSSDALDVALLLGLEDIIIERARELLLDDSKK